MRINALQNTFAAALPGIDTDADPADGKAEQPFQHKINNGYGNQGEVRLRTISPIFVRSCTAM